MIFVMVMFLKAGNIIYAGVDADKNSIKQSGIQIVVNETCVVEREHILLGDIAQIQASGFLKDGLAKIDVGKSPKPDKIKSFTKRKIISAIRTQQFLPENLSVFSPDQIYVKRAAQYVTKEDVRAFILQKVSQTFKNRDFQLASLSIRGIEPYPRGNLLLRLISNDMIDKNGRVSAFVEIVVNGRKVDKLSVSGRVKVYEDVLCANKNLGRGQRASATDVVSKKRNIFALGDDVIRHFDELDQKVVRFGVKKGDYLKSSLFEEVPLVKKGDIIRLLSKNENLLIVTSGISKEDGVADKLIRVENLSSGKLVRGIVKDKSTVEVVY